VGESSKNGFIRGIVTFGSALLWTTTETSKEQYKKKL